MTELGYRLRYRWRCWRDRLDLYSRDRWTNPELAEIETAAAWSVLLLALAFGIMAMVGR